MISKITKSTLISLLLIAQIVFAFVAAYVLNWGDFLFFSLISVSVVLKIPLFILMNQGKKSLLEWVTSLVYLLEILLNILILIIALFWFVNWT